MITKYEDLTPEERMEICNGCGGKGSIIKPPHRKRCDIKFYNAMVMDCTSLPWYNYLRYRPWCWVYYHSVREFGKKYFYFADKPRQDF